MSLGPPLLQKKIPLKKGFSFGIAASIRIGREIRCLPYAGFFFSKVDFAEMGFHDNIIMYYTSQMFLN